MHARVSVRFTRKAVSVCNGRCARDRCTSACTCAVRVCVCMRFRRCACVCVCVTRPVCMRVPSLLRQRVWEKRESGGGEAETECVAARGHGASQHIRRKASDFWAVCGRVCHRTRFVLPATCPPSGDTKGVAGRPLKARAMQMTRKKGGHAVTGGPVPTESRRPHTYR